MQRKATKNTRGPSKAEKDFQAWLKEQPCCIGGVGVTEVHHCKGSTFKHNKVLIGHWFCIPLSKDSHDQYHASTKRFRLQWGLQSDLWLAQVKQYGEEGGQMPDGCVVAAIMGCGY